MQIRYLFTCLRFSLQRPEHILEDKYADNECIQKLLLQFIHQFKMYNNL